jgi:hypothetical protein
MGLNPGKNTHLPDRRCQVILSPKWILTRALLLLCLPPPADGTRQPAPPTGSAIVERTRIWETIPGITVQAFFPAYISSQPVQMDPLRWQDFVCRWELMAPP